MLGPEVLPEKNLWGMLVRYFRGWMPSCP